MYENFSVKVPELQRFAAAERHRIWVTGMRKAIYSWQFFLLLPLVVIAAMLANKFLAAGLDGRLRRKGIFLLSGLLSYLILRSLVMRRARSYWASLGDGPAPRRGFW